MAVQPRVFGSDIATDQCRGVSGYLIGWNSLFALEIDHVTDRGGIRRDDEAHLVACCAWHHRGSGWRIDTKPRRAVLRDMLAGLYPAEWAR